MALADFLVSLLTVVSVYTLFGLGLNVKYASRGWSTSATCSTS